MERLDGNNYRRWSKYMLFYFTPIDFAYVLFMNPKSVECAKKPRINASAET